MNQEVVRKDIVGNPAEVHLEEASGLVSSVACEPFIAPAGHRIQRTARFWVREDADQLTRLLVMTYGSYALWYCSTLYTVPAPDGVA